jgi:peptidoglycan/LPS O-acetylase OafA/YrhL
MTVATVPDERWRLGYRPALDGIRGIAILMVVLYHARIASAELHWYGSNGVSIFFTLSGFLITRLLVEERLELGGISLRGFYARRALRLLPAFGVMVALTAMVGLASVSEALRASSYLGNWWLAADQPLGALNQTWSLSIEEQFYLVWPLLLVVPLTVGPRIIAIALLGLTLGYRLLGPQATEAEYAFATHMQIPMVLIGVCLALVWGPDMRPPRWSVWLGVALIVLASLLPPGEPGRHIASPVASLGAVFLILAALGQGRAARALAAAPLVALGLLSYSLYLWHYPVMFALGVVPHASATDPGRSLLSIVVSVLLAVVSYRLIELPILAIRKRFRRPRERPMAVGGVTSAQS